MVDEGAAPRFWRGSLTARSGAPVELDATASELEAPPHFRQMVGELGKTLKAYLVAARGLLQGRYSALQEFAPPYMAVDSYPVAVVCDDGILVRYDRAANPECRVRVGVVDESIATLAPGFSDLVLHCPENAEGYDIGEGGLRLNLLKRSPNGVETPLLSTRLAVLTARRDWPNSLGCGLRPVPAMSLQNEIDVFLEGQSIPDAARFQVELTRRFVMRGRVRLSVGWHAIEVYPPYPIDSWKPDLAPLWAENDLLATAARRQLQEAELRVMDPNIGTRKHFEKLLSDFQTLLDGPEEPVHQFLKSHPEILNPNHLKVWSKLPLGSAVTDFVFLEAPSDYVFVELESPLSELFRADGQIREELVHAHNQCLDWQRYIEDNPRTVQTELGLEALSAQPRFLIVMGRSAALNEANRRKLVTWANQAPKIQIWTYDDLLSFSRATIERLVGPMWGLTGSADVYYLP